MEQLKIEFNNRVLKQSPYLTTSHRTGTMSWSRTITGSPTRCADVRLALRHIGCRSIPTNRCPSTTRSWWLYTNRGRGRALWSIVVVCQETISARVKNASCVWATMSCAGGMSALGSWARGAGICGLASLCLAWGRC